MKKFLVPTDFSTCANNAVNFAVQSAKLLPVEVTLLHSFEQNESAYSNYVGLDKEYTRIMLHDLKEKMDLLKSTIQEEEGVSVATIVSNQTLEASIENLHEEKNIDLVVMGTLGETGLRELFWGSQTASVIENSSIPTLVIPYYYNWEKPSKFAVAINHFDEDPAAFSFLFDMLKLYNAQLDIITFTEEHRNASQIKSQMQAYEDRLKNLFLDSTITSHHVSGIEFEETLQDYIKENNIDVLVMISYHQSRNFLYRLFNSSETKRMSYHTEVPLLVIPGDK